MRSRSLVAERMDDPGIEAREHEDALRGLARINAFSRTVGAFWSPLRALAERHGELRVLDLACGGGTLAAGLARRAAAAGVPLRMHGCDISPRAIRVAREHDGVEFFEADLFGDAFPDGFDIYINSLFLHHLTDERAAQLLRRMATGRAFILEDLRRTRMGYLLARWGVRFLSRSPVVLHDAPVSVRNAFTMPEVNALLSEANVRGARIGACWPQRFRVEWERA